MQRRAAAMYFAFFVIVGAAAYGLIATTSAPHVSLDGPSYTQGDTVDLGERTWTVSTIEAESSGGGGGHGGGGGGIARSGELSWTNESAIVSTSIDNGSDVPVTDVVWDDQAARNEATFADGDSVAFNGSEYDVSVNATAGTLTLTNPDNPADNTTVEAGGTFEYQGFEATVTDVSGGEATVVWGFPYLLAVQTENVSDPTEAVFVEQRNLTQLAATDPALYPDVFTQDGVRKVTFRANDTNVPALEYFGEPERHTIAEGETLRYQGNETTVDAVANESVTLTRPGVTTQTVELGEGENVTVGGEEYFAHFPDNSTVQIFSTAERYSDYHADEVAIRDYGVRKTGLWGVVDLSIVAVILLLATALLPVRG